MIKNLLHLLLFLLVSQTSVAQVGIGTVNPDASSILDVTSIDKGFLPPRVANTSTINNPATGLMIYNTTEKCIQVNIGTPASPEWTCMNSNSGSGGSSGNAFSAANQDWSTKLRFPKFGLTTLGGNQYEGYGITADKNLFLWGRDYYGYIHSFNKTRVPTSDVIHAISPYFIDFPNFNGKVEKFTTDDFTYAVLTTDNNIWIWGNQVNNIMGNNPSGTQNTSNGISTPINFTLPSGETGFTDLHIFRNRIFFLTESGNLYLRGAGVTTNFTTSLVQFAKPSGVSASFKYTKILEVFGSQGIFLQGSNGKYYSIMFHSSSNTNFAGNATAPRPSTSTYYDGTNSANVHEIEFPVGHGEITKMIINGSTFLTLDNNGKIYAWGYHETSNSYISFKTDATNTINIPNRKVFITPVEVKLPTGETAFKDMAAGVDGLSLFVTASGKLYLIGSESYGSAHLGIYHDDHTYEYVEIINTGGKVNQISGRQKAIMFSSEENELFGIGRSEYANLGNPTNTNSSNIYIIHPTPLINGNLDRNNDNVQNPN